MRRLLASALLCSALISSSHAAVISLGSVDLSGQGLGATDPLLTLHATGRATIEAGAAATIFGALHWGAASDVRVLFNASEPGGNSITIDQITFSFRSGANILNLSNAAPLVFASTDPGLGNAGFLLGLDAPQMAALALFLQSAPNLAAVEFGLAAALSNVAGGIETFSPIIAIPLPPAGWLLLSALAGVMLLSRRRVRKLSPTLA